MPADISPKKVQDAVHTGAKRMHNFRKARLMFLRSYVGQYYDRESGNIGTEPLNMIFNAVRTLVPNIVMDNPTHKVRSEWLHHRDYAELLQLALAQQDRQMDITNIYRQLVVDAIFTMGIMKTGLAASDSVLVLDEYNKIDTGEIFTEIVDFDNFVVDPASRKHLFADASFMGDRLCVPRESLLESGLYDNELIERLPSVNESRDGKRDRASEISKRKIHGDDEYLQDEVEVYELWIPSAQAIVTVPADKNVSFDRYLRVDDYYGPKEGPYTLLSLTPPVPSNPMPVPMVGIWQDLHTLANRMASKIVDQAERQKDVMAYRQNAADDANELLEAGDGEAVSVEDPDAVNVLSFGGQRSSNEAYLNSMAGWFNMMAANPRALGGQNMDADSATEARYLANQGSIGLEDMEGLVYDASAKESRKRAWYLHTDPFIQLPLIRRTPVQQPPVVIGGIPLSNGSRIEDQQVVLTPEARRGDWLDYTFKIEPESMSRKDSQQRFMEAMDFAVKILPAVMQATQTAYMIGMPFDAQTFLVKMSHDRGIDWLDEVFFDPNFQQRYLMMMMMGPQAAESKGQPSGGLGAVLQNGQPGQVMGGVPGLGEQMNQDAQLGANAAQSQGRAGGQQSMY